MPYSGSIHRRQTAGKIGRVKQLIRFSCAANLLCGLIVFITLHNFSNPIVSLFFSEAEINVIEIATRGGEIVAYAFFFNALNIFMSSFFTAMDRRWNFHAYCHIERLDTAYPMYFYTSDVFLYFRIILVLTESG